MPPVTTQAEKAALCHTMTVLQFEDWRNDVHAGIDIFITILPNANSDM